MAVPFGFSIGDFIAGINVIVTAIKAVQEKRGASAEYAALLTELTNLEAGLNAVDDLDIDPSQHSQCKAIEHAVKDCQDCVESFIRSIAKYQPWLRPHATNWRANLRKMQWAFCEKDDIRNLRDQLEHRSSSINMLLMTLQISQTAAIGHQQQHLLQSAEDTHQAMTNLHVDVLENMDLINRLSLQQKQGFCSLAQTVTQLQSMLHLQQELPPQVTLQKPVILLDACGKVAPFHLDFITSVDALQGALKARFRDFGVGAAGLEKVDRFEFVPQDHRGDLSLAKPWNTIFKPGQSVNMSMVFRRSAELEYCPRCQARNVPVKGSHTLW